MPATTPPAPTDRGPDLDAECDHLSDARVALSRVRERTAGLDSSAAGDRISQERLESAEDHGEARAERFHVGRRHVTDEAGEPMVVDWRAPISRACYRASRAEPMGVDLPRRYGFVQGAPGTGKTARTREVRRYVDLAWPALDAARPALRLLGDADLLAAAADGVLTDVAALRSADVPHEVLGEGPRTPGDARLDVVPASLAKGLEFDHVVLVEPAGIVA